MMTNNKLEFGTGKIWIVPEVAADLSWGSIHLQDGKGCGVVGKETKTCAFNDYNDTVVLHFTNTESIDALVHELGVLKSGMTDGVETWNRRDKVIE